MRGNDRTQSWHSTSARPGGPRVVDGGGGEAPEVVAGRAKSPIAFPMECETVKLDSAVMPGKLSHLDPVHQCCLDPVDPGQQGQTMDRSVNTVYYQWPTMSSNTLLRRN